jgi:hypothetical protein
VVGLNQHLSQNRDYFGYTAEHVPVGSVQFYNDALTPLLDSFKALEEKYKAYVSSIGQAQEQHADYERVLGQADALRKELGYQKGKVIEHIGATVSDINAMGTEIETSKEALIGKISDLKDGIKGAFGVPDVRQFASIAQNLAFMGEGDFSRAMMISSQSADLFSDFTEAAAKITTDDGTKIDKSYVINRLDVIGRDVADLNAGYKVSQQFIQKNEQGHYRLAQKAQQFDELCERFYNTSDKARAAESAMEKYLGKIEYRNTKIDEYNALWAKLVDIQGRLDKVNADADKTQIALARSEDPGLPHRVATITGLYNRSRDACIEYLYWMSRAYMFWALQPSDEFAKVCKLSDPDSIDYDTLSSARAQILRDCTNEIQKVQATLRPDAFPAKEADLKVATGITVSMDRTSHPDVIASLRKKGVAEFEIPVATQESKDNSFAGLANVRLSRVRAWIHGLRARTDLHFVSITHCGGLETIVTPGNKRIKFVHDPVSVPFRYDASVGVENPRAIFEGKGGSMDGVVLENNYAPIGPFGRWRIAILEKNNAGLDRTKIEKVVMEFHGMAELFAKDAAGKPTGRKIRRPSQRS